jgi:hypothetical protein
MRETFPSAAISILDKSDSLICRRIIQTMMSNPSLSEMIVNEGSDPSRRELFRYIIASHEMRYIERAERRVHLLQESEAGWILRGFIPGCGASCEADLALVILEFLVSSGGGDKEASRASLRTFADRLGTSTVDHIRQMEPQADVDRLYESVSHCLFRSMGVGYTMQRDGNRYTGTFTQCPICKTSEESGLHRGCEIAHEVFVRLCRTAFRRLHPNAEVIARGSLDQPGHSLSLEITRPSE